MKPGEGKAKARAILQGCLKRVEDIPGDDMVALLKLHKVEEFVREDRPELAPLIFDILMEECGQWLREQQITPFMLAGFAIARGQGDKALERILALVPEKPPTKE